MRRRLARGGLAWAALCLAVPALAAPEAIVGILQGPATVLRQTQRLTLVEGAALAEGDIVETGKGTFAQLEFADGTLAGVGGSTRLLLRPPARREKGRPGLRLYLLEGWLKLRLPGAAAAAAGATGATTAAPAASAATGSGAAFGVLSPPLELEGKDASAVLRIQDKAWAVFVETGSARALQRTGAKATLTLKRGDFASVAAGQDKPTVSPRVPEAVLAEMPRPFLDTLPARAERFAKRSVNLPPLASPGYDDVAHWLRTEPYLRLGLTRQWTPLASDPAFRKAAAANLKLHPEWERILFPERFEPKEGSESLSDATAAPSRKR